ncbi:MAG TPA: SGNH family hydrolase [Devosia sp.]|nr:SGNH family hydrolase [Devosia sp.]
MFRRLALIVVLMLFAGGELAPVLFVSPAIAQEQPQKKRRTLFDMLFGGGQQQAQEAPAPKAEKAPKAAALPPPKPEVEKAPGATRLAVFGDSLAVDLAKALDRFYAEDPNIVIINQGVGSSGFVRDDFFDWDKTAKEQVEANSFDIAVMIIGINDRQTLKVDGKNLKPLTDEWVAAYQPRVRAVVDAIHNAGKPLIWIGLPAMSKADFSTAMGQISAIQRLAVFAGGAEFLDIYERFVDDEGKYTSYGPDLNGARVKMRKDDGIHFSAAGADKLAFYLSQSIKLFYRGGGAVGIEVADALAGTDAALMVRPPYQGLGQIRLLEVAGAVIPLSATPKRASDLVVSGAVPVAATPSEAFDMTMLVEAPAGRADAFGVGTVREAETAGP